MFQFRQLLFEGANGVDVEIEKVRETLVKSAIVSGQFLDAIAHGEQLLLLDVSPRVRETLVEKIVLAKDGFAFLDDLRERLGIVVQDVPKVFFAQRVQIGVAERFDIRRSTIAVLRTWKPPDRHFASLGQRPSPTGNVQNGDFSEH